MNRAPSIIASVSLVVAALAIGPFGQASGNDSVAASFSSAGADLEGTVDLQDSTETYDVSCGESLVVGATDIITTDTDFSGTVEHDGRRLEARTDEAQFVQQNGVVLCIDAEGPLFDADGVDVARWHLRPDGDGDGVTELRITE